jgi:hypothetical protein
MSMLQLYVLCRLDSIRELSVLFAVISGISSAAGFLFIMCDAGCPSAQRVGEPAISCVKRWTRRAKIVAAISVVLVTVVPTTKQAAFIYMTAKITQHDSVKDMVDMPEKVVRVLQIKMDEYLEELSGGSLQKTTKETTDEN